MPKKNHIYIPEAPLQLIELAENVILKHEMLGPESPLSLFDMSSFKELFERAKCLLNSNAVYQSNYLNIRNEILGVDRFRNAPDSLLRYLRLIKNQLMIHYDFDQEKLRAFGFHQIDETPMTQKAS
ncbi:MAG: hypothetical protein MRY83_19345 [Flavobacteriales bacterium]|nr:hypothetical protein [Flavobacteriales bacterium]